MPQSTFVVTSTEYIDLFHPGAVNTNMWSLGTIVAGSSKVNLDRCIGAFDVFGAAAAGRPLALTDAITAADLILNCGAILGPSAWPASIERLTRADWDAASGDWNNYKTASAWTTAGGDIATPPAAVGFTSPSALGDITIGGLLTFVIDAITNRGGKLLLRLRANDESTSAGTKWASFRADPALTVAPRLRVTYIAAEPVPIARPAAGTLPGDRASPISRADPAARPAKWQARGE